jgi:hypothetical protein
MRRRRLSSITTGRVPERPSVRLLRVRVLASQPLHLGWAQAVLKGEAEGWARGHRFLSKRLQRPFRSRVSQLSGSLVERDHVARRLAKPKMAVSIPDDTAELVWQAAESLYTLGSCLREGRIRLGARAAPRR